MKALALFFFLPLVALAASENNIFVVSQTTAAKIGPVGASAFRDALAAELAAYGFSTSVRSDQFAEDAEGETINEASTLNQARQADAAYALVATLRNLKSEVREYSGNDVATSNRLYSLSFSYRLLNSANGTVLTGGNGSVRKTLRATEGAVTAESDTTGDLIGLAASRIAEEVAADLKPDELQKDSDPSQSVEFTIVARGMGLTVPEVTELESGELYVTGERGDITLDAVTVLIDGVAVGSAPDTLEATPGLHEVTLQREGFEDWKRTVNIREDLDLIVRMSATDAEIRRFREQSAFLEGLRTQRVLTDAEAEKIRGIAKMYAQSGYRWDIKVDTDEAITIEQNNRTIMGDNPAN